jgi:hypothetical protein
MKAADAESVDDLNAISLDGLSTDDQVKLEELRNEKIQEFGQEESEDDNFFDGLDPIDRSAKPQTGPRIWRRRRKERKRGNGDDPNQRESAEEEGEE